MGLGSILSKIGGKIVKALPIPGAGYIGDAVEALPDVLGAGGKAAGAATTAAGQNRLNQEQLALQANGQNIQGTSAFERALLERSLAEQNQRKQAARDVFMASRAANPVRSPYNTSAPPQMSDAYKGTLSALEKAGVDQLATPAKYSMAAAPAMTPYTPLDIKNLQGATGTQKGTLEKIGDWAAPGLSLASILARLGSRKPTTLSTGTADTTGTDDYGTEDWYNH